MDTSRVYLPYDLVGLFIAKATDTPNQYRLTHLLIEGNAGGLTKDAQCGKLALLPKRQSARRIPHYGGSLIVHDLDQEDTVVTFQRDRNQVQGLETFSFDSHSLPLFAHEPDDSLLHGMLFCEYARRWSAEDLRMCLNASLLLKSMLDRH